MIVGAVKMLQNSSVVQVSVRCKLRGSKKMMMGVSEDDAKMVRRGLYIDDKLG